MMRTSKIVPKCMNGSCEGVLIKIVTGPKMVNCGSVEANMPPVRRFSRGPMTKQYGQNLVLNGKREEVHGA